MNKKYLIEHYQEKFRALEKEDYLFCFRYCNLELCEVIDLHLREMVQTLSKSDLESLLYDNKYERKIEDNVIARIVNKIEVSKEKFSWYLNFENDILDIEVDPKEDKKLLDKVCCEFDGNTSCNQRKTS